MIKLYKYSLILLITLLAISISRSSLAALSPEISEELKGKAAPDFSLYSIDKKEIKLADYKDKIVLINFFGTWCPPCRAQIVQLTKIYKKYKKNEVVILGVAADPLIAPKSQEETLKDVKELKDKLNISYQVTVATKQFGKNYNFKGIPTTIFIDSNGRFVKTFYGYHHGKRFENLLESLLASTISKINSKESMNPNIPKINNLFKPFIQIWTNPPQQLHPLLIHFPIAFLILESLFIILFWITNKTHFEVAAYSILKWSFWSILIALLAGLHDVGLVLEKGNKILLGLKDRIENAFRFESSITVHSWLAVSLLVITGIRFLWRKLGRENTLKGFAGICFGIITVICLWLLLSTAYIGGLISHY